MNAIEIQLAVQLSASAVSGFGRSSQSIENIVFSERGTMTAVLYFEFLRIVKLDFIFSSCPAQWRYELFINSFRQGDHNTYKPKVV